MVSFYHPPLPDAPDVQVVVRWRNGRASLQEVAALRQLLIEVRNRPIAEVFREARSKAEWVIATCHPALAWRSLEQAERAGLVAVVKQNVAGRPHEGVRMAVTRSEAAALALQSANRTWGFPRAGEELVIVEDWVAESDSAWAFTYNTRSFVETGDIMRALGVGNGPIVVEKSTGAVHQMSSAYSAREALRVWGKAR